MRINVDFMEFTLHTLRENSRSDADLRGDGFFNTDDMKGTAPPVKHWSILAVEQLEF